MTSPHDLSISTEPDGVAGDEAAHNAGTVMLIGRTALTDPPATIYQAAAHSLARVMTRDGQGEAGRVARDYQRDIGADPRKLLDAARLVLDLPATA